MIIVSPETHSHLFLIKGHLQNAKGKNITLDEVMKVIIESYTWRNMNPNNRQLEEKEWKIILIVLNKNQLNSHIIFNMDIVFIVENINNAPYKG